MSGAVVPRRSFALVHLGDRAPTMSAAEARRLTDELKEDFARGFVKLGRVFNEGGWKALGYSSWGHYCKVEGGLSRSVAYRAIEHARVWESLENGTVIAVDESPAGDSKPSTDAQMRELARARREGGSEAMREVWREAVERHGPKPTGRQVHEIVQRRVGPKPKPKPKPAPLPEWCAVLRSAAGSYQRVADALSMLAMPLASSASRADHIDQLFEQLEDIRRGQETLVAALVELREEDEHAEREARR